MPRPPRELVPEWPVHIIQRGNNRMKCFRDDGDFLVYLALIRHLARVSGCKTHAYCLMGNHVHLLVTPTRQHGCSKFMKGLAQRYSYYFNRKYERSGPLWEGRFKSCVVRSSRYVLACYRYIELNPVRAGIVGHPAAYLWSSYAINSGSRTDPDISPHEEWRALGATIYSGLVAELLDEHIVSEIREATNCGLALDGTSVMARKGRPGRKPQGESVSDTDLPLFSEGGVS